MSIQIKCPNCGSTDHLSFTQGEPEDSMYVEEWVCTRCGTNGHNNFVFSNQVVTEAKNEHLVKPTIKVGDKVMIKKIGGVNICTAEEAQEYFGRPYEVLGTYDAGVDDPPDGIGLGLDLDFKGPQLIVNSWEVEKIES